LTPIDESNDRGEAARGFRHLRERSEVCFDEGRLEEQILGWISRDGQLGKGDEIRADGARLHDAIDDAAGLALRVPARRIDLGGTHTEAPHAAIVTVRSSTRPGIPQILRVASTIPKRYSIPQSTDADGQTCQHDSRVEQPREVATRLRALGRHDASPPRAR